jgi:hypothetical protein
MVEVNCLLKNYWVIPNRSTWQNMNPLYKMSCCGQFFSKKKILVLKLDKIDFTLFYLTTELRESESERESESKREIERQ